MPVVWRGDHYSVDIFPRQKFAEIGMSFAALVAGRFGMFRVVILHLLFSGFAAVGIHIAYRHYLCLLLAQETAHEAAALHAVSDETEADAVTRICGGASDPRGQDEWG